MVNPEYLGVYWCVSTNCPDVYNHSDGLLRSCIVRYWGSGPGLTSRMVPWSSSRMTLAEQELTRKILMRLPCVDSCACHVSSMFFQYKNTIYIEDHWFVLKDQLFSIGMKCARIEKNGRIHVADPKDWGMVNWLIDWLNFFTDSLLCCSAINFNIFWGIFLSRPGSNYWYISCLSACQGIK